MQVCIGDLLYDPTLFNKDGNTKQDVDKAESYLQKLENFDNKFSIGGYYLNKWHFRSLIAHYVTLANQGKMMVSFRQVLEYLASKKFDEFTSYIQEYEKLMTSQLYLPNSPTMMNAGGRLGQLSACFVLDMKDDMYEIMKSTTDAALIFKSGGGVGINYSDLASRRGHSRFHIWGGLWSGIIHEYNKHCNRGGKAGWQASWCQHGYTGSVAPGY